jgi:hypothetical protein
MPKPAKLTLILASGTSEVLPQLQDVALRAWLARAAARGRLREQSRDTPAARDHLDFEWQLLGALGLHDQADLFASAPICRAADSVSEDYWVHAEPMHFAAGMTRLDAVALTGSAAVSGTEREELGSTMGEYIHSLGLKWSAAGCWLIGFPRDLAVQTQQPNLTVDLEQAMPSGRDARELRRLMTELQMLLHAHPVNARRERAGLPAINAVWVWGSGSIKVARCNYVTAGQIKATDSSSDPSAQIKATDSSSDPSAQIKATDSSPKPSAHVSDVFAPISSSSVQLFGTDPFTRGLAKAIGLQAIAPHSPEVILNNMNGRDAVAVLESIGPDLLARWLQPLQAALASGRLRSLVIAIDRWTIELNRWSSWRLWRRDVPLESWSEA